MQLDWGISSFSMTLQIPCFLDKKYLIFDIIIAISFSLSAIDILPPSMNRSGSQLKLIQGWTLEQGPVLYFNLWTAAAFVRLESVCHSKLPKMAYTHYTRPPIWGDSNAMLWSHLESGEEVCKMQSSNILSIIALFVVVFVVCCCWCCCCCYCCCLLLLMLLLLLLLLLLLSR